MRPRPHLPTICLAAGLLVILAACGSPTATPAPTSAPEIATAVSPASTSTMVPAATPVPTAVLTTAPASPPAPTPAPSLTPLPPLAVAEDGFRVWCLPVDAPAAAKAPGEAPANARKGAYVPSAEAFQVIIPASACTLAYTFNQPVAQDVQLEAYYTSGVKPWLSAGLTPAVDNPSVGTITLNQPYVLDPPFWQVNYRFVVKAAGKEVRSDWVSFYKLVERCWEGSLPDPVTLACPAADVREPEPNPGITPSSPDYRK